MHAHQEEPSLDASEAVEHDRIRGLPGLFERGLRGLDAALGTGMSVGISAQVLRERIANLATTTYAFALGASWTPARWVNVQFGNGKQFVGNGYRSVLLSDNAFNYPYLKFSFLSHNNRWQYTTFHAKLTELQRYLLLMLLTWVLSTRWTWS